MRLLLMMWVMLASVKSEEEVYPPRDLRGDWAELQELDFHDWVIRDFLGWDVPFDGGSKVFFLRSDRGDRFDLVMANPAYWTEQEKKAQQQVFLIRYKNRFYRIEPASEEEKEIIGKIAKAAARLQGDGKRDPQLLTKLAECLRSRKPQFKLDG